MGKTRESANLVSDNNIFVDINNDTVGIKTTNPRFTLEVGPVGASGTSLHVNGNARITGILTVGSSSIVINPDDDSIALSNDTIIRRDISTGDVRFLDNSGNTKRIIANEVRVGSGNSVTVLKSSGSGSIVFENSDGQQVSVGGTWITFSSNTNLDLNTKYLANTSSGIVTATLPASPQTGDYIVIADSRGFFSTNNLVIDRNGSYINGVAENLEADVAYATINLTFTGISTIGWLVK